MRGSRANRARILRGAQCGVSGPSNACKQSQKTTMMMERGTRERLTDRQTDSENANANTTTTTTWQ